MREARESAIVGSERFIVRPATAGDVKEMSGILDRAGLSSSRTVEFNLANPTARMFVGCRDGLMAGVAGCIRFGRTGWLGNVAVDDDFRGQGLGRAMSQTAVDCLHQAGVETVLKRLQPCGRLAASPVVPAQQLTSQWRFHGSPILRAGRYRARRSQQARYRERYAAG